MKGTTLRLVVSLFHIGKFWQKEWCIIDICTAKLHEHKKQAPKKDFLGLYITDANTIRIPQIAYHNKKCVL